MIRKLIEKLYWRYCQEDLSGNDIVPEQLDAILESVSSISGYRDFLKALARQDKERYFHAQTDSDRENIRGSYARIVFLYRQLVDRNKPSEDTSKPNKVKFKLGSRYA